MCAVRLKVRLRLKVRVRLKVSVRVMVWARAGSDLWWGRSLLVENDLEYPFYVFLYVS